MHVPQYHSPTPLAQTEALCLANTTFGSIFSQRVEGQKGEERNRIFFPMAIQKDPETVPNIQMPEKGKSKCCYESKSNLNNWQFTAVHCYPQICYLPQQNANLQLMSRKVTSPQFLSSAHQHPSYASLKRKPHTTSVFLFKQSKMYSQLATGNQGSGCSQAWLNRSSAKFSQAFNDHTQAGCQHMKLPYTELDPWSTKVHIVYSDQQQFSRILSGGLSQLLL